MLKFNKNLPQFAFLMLTWGGLICLSLQTLRLIFRNVGFDKDKKWILFNERVFEPQIEVIRC